MVKRRTGRNTVLWTVATGIGLIGVIIFSSAVLQNSKGDPLFEKPDTLIGIVITALGGLMAVLLPALLRFERNSEELKEQVKNDHKKPDGTPLLLRDDLDDKHDVILARLDSLQDKVDISVGLSQANASDVRGIRKDMGRLHDDLSRMRTNLEASTTETTRVGRLTSGLIKTVSTLEGEVTQVKATIVKHHPEENS